MSPKRWKTKLYEDYFIPYWKLFNIQPAATAPVVKIHSQTETTQCTAQAEQMATIYGFESLKEFVCTGMCIHTLTFWLGVRGRYPGCASCSLFLCCVSEPMSVTKCVLRWRRNNVLFDGIDRMEANTSAPNRGSKTWKICTSYYKGTFNQIPFKLIQCHIGHHEYKCMWKRKDIV